jgi:hypothetical protein
MGLRTIVRNCKEDVIYTCEELDKAGEPLTSCS